jgi:hypothetical protein
MEGIFPKLLAVRDWVERGHVNGLETHKLAHAWCRKTVKDESEIK